MALRCDHLADHQAPGDLAPGGGGLRAAVVPSPRDRPPGAAGDRWPADPGAAASTRGRGATGTLDRAPRAARGDDGFTSEKREAPPGGFGVLGRAGATPPLV